jgi:TetR/AcrR family transcriptional regulator, regulator of autoinduction and epiphytic fitness
MSDRSLESESTRIDPRIKRTRSAVLTAALEVLSRRGYAAFAMEAVAESAQVARSTIYRHWPNKIDLIAEALETLNQQPHPNESSATAREQTERLLVHLADVFVDSVFSACIPALIEAAERHPEVAGFLHGYSARRRQTLVDVLRTGIDNGELPAHLDPELAALALSSPIIYRRTMTPDPFPADRVPQLIDQVLGPPAPI